jgi:hypothetical protein
MPSVIIGYSESNELSLISIKWIVNRKCDEISRVVLDWNRGNKIVAAQNIEEFLKVILEFIDLEFTKLIVI